MTTDAHDDPRTLPALVAAVLVCLALTACGGTDDGGGQGGQGPDGSDAETPIPAVEVVQAREGALPLQERLTGTVRASGQVAIFPQTTGPIVEVMAQNGDRVQEGDPLVRIRSETSRSQLEQARANLNAALAESQQARANLEELEGRLRRTRQLAEEDLVSREQLESQQAQVAAARASYEQAQAQVEAARATVEERREAIDQTVVRAPISGRVGQRNAEVGMQATGQTPLFTIGSLESMRVEVPVTQEMLGQLEVGQRVEISAENLPDTTITAEISRISPFLEEGSFSAEAEIDVPNAEGTLMPGMFVVADVFYGESEIATLLPQSAIYDHPDTGQQGVYVATGLGEPQTIEADSGTGLTEPRPTRFHQVEVAAEGAQVVGVRGIDPGTWVVVVGQHLLSDQGREETPIARMRTVNWDRVLTLQGLQEQDFLRQFMEKQQRLGRRLGDTLGGGTLSEEL